MDRDAAGRLAAALALRTVTSELTSEDSARAFAEFRSRLRVWFPAGHARLTRQEIGDDGALLYQWNGSSPDLKPWLFVSHQDVVDTSEHDGPAWTHPPFAGEIDAEFIWGRGAIDLKITIMAVFEAIERLVASDFRPKRSLVLALGADEETGGHRGARLIAEALRKLGMRFAFSLDEGGVITSDTVPGVERPVAAIGVAEKGELSIKFTSLGVGGHSSLPGGRTPVDRLLAFLNELPRTLPPARLDDPSLMFLRSLAPVSRGLYRAIYRHAHALSGLILLAAGNSAPVRAATRTTLAVTRLDAGRANNVIPSSANAIVNYRLLPGDGADEILDAVRPLCRKHDLQLDVVDSLEASRVSDTRSSAYQALCASIGAVMPDAFCAPYLTPNGTDSRHYEDLTDNQYRFIPVRLGPGDLGRIHGVDERISLKNYAEAINFYADFIRRADSIAD